MAGGHREQTGSNDVLKKNGRHPGVNEDIELAQALRRKQDLKTIF